MTNWQKLLSLFGADYIYLVTGNNQLSVRRAYLRSGIYVMHSTTKSGDLSVLPKASMARTPYDLSVVLTGFHPGQIRPVHWTPLTTKMRAWYNMLPEGDTVTAMHSVDQAPISPAPYIPTAPKSHP